MSQKFFSILILAVAMMLFACTTPPTGTIPPSPVPLQVSYSPYLAGIQDALQVCIRDLPQAAIFFEQVSGEQQSFSDPDLVIWWGDKPQEVEFAFPLNMDELVVITNPANPNQALNQSELFALFSGRIAHWTEISTLDQQVQVWIYPEPNLMSTLFSNAILDGRPMSRQALIAPTSEAMLESISSNPGAIGFIPHSWITSDVQPIQIDPDLQIALHKPLLALTPTEPAGELKALVACLQSGSGQDKLAAYYEKAE